jgi:CDP-diacylglycerol--serine O-phosphatidyltransferase
VLDGLDGRSARLLKLQSNFGAQLDSLADFLSFGVAPAMLVYLWSLHQVRGFGWTLALLFATCCALRLARFNTELDDPDQPAWKANFFTGIPAPAAAGCVMLPVLAAFAFDTAWPRIWPVTAAFTVFVALMMVSRVPTYSFKRVRVKPEWVLPTLVLAGLLVASLAHVPWLTLAIVGALYLASLPLGVLAAGRMRRREATAGTQAPPPDEEITPRADGDARPPAPRHHPVEAVASGEGAPDEQQGRDAKGRIVRLGGGGRHHAATTAGSKPPA